MKTINILVTLDENYLTPLRTMIKSLVLNNPNAFFNIYMIYSDIGKEKIDGLNKFCLFNKAKLIPIEADTKIFAGAPVFRHYTQAMYYRLLAYEILPESVDKVLYMDPDILVINPIDELYNIDIEDYLYAAAIHTQIIGIAETVNKIRLNAYESEGYYNSGVLLMNIKAQREVINKSDIFNYVNEHKSELILPDQDVLNSLYGHKILSIDDSLYNFDARKSDTYLISSIGVKDLNWVMDHTVLLHFCGKNKPWHKSSKNRYTSLYKHYAHLAEADTM